MGFAASPSELSRREGLEMEFSHAHTKPPKRWSSEGFRVGEHTGVLGGWRLVPLPLNLPLRVDSL